MIEQEKYDAMHEEAFLNDIWNGFTDGGKFDVLARELGEDIFEKTYDEWHAEFLAKEADMRESLGIEDLNEETHVEVDYNEENK